MNSKKNFYEKLYIYSFWIAVSLTIILSLILYIFGKNSSWRDQIYSIGTNLISSVIFAILFTFLANKEFMDLVRNELYNKSEKTFNSLIGEIQRFNTSYLPSNEYIPSTGYDLKFNSDLTDDLNKTSVYLFRGISAKYVPARVKSSNQTLAILKVLLLDPKDTSSLNLSASDRNRNPKYQKQSRAELVDQLKQEIYTSVIALFDCRYICQIEIAYVSETAVTRLEVFDQALYLGFYHNDQGSAITFPTTLRYERGSLFYAMYQMDCFREFEVSKNKIKFTSTDSDNELVNHLIEIGMNNVNIDTVEKIRKGYAVFQNNFIKESGILQK